MIITITIDRYALAITRIVSKFQGRKEGLHMARIDAAYEYFLTTYGDNIGSRYASHKKSELRDTYNSIVKTNKQSPLYKISDSSDVGSFAIDIKEHANDIARSVANLTANGQDIESVLEKRIATTSNDEAVEATFIGDNDSNASSFEIQVDALASPQVNFGNYLNPGAKDFEDGQHSFDLDVRNSSYEFQFNVNKNDTNLSIQQKIARLINTSDVGLTADINTDSKGQTALFVVSKATGLSNNEDRLFNIQSGSSWNELNTLGIQNITQPAANSQFTLNGVQHSSLSNTFTVNKSFELTLKQTTEDPVSVGLMNDTDALADGIGKLLDSYNGMLTIGSRYSSGHGNNTLFNEVTRIASSMSDSLAAVGITPDEDSQLVLDTDVLSDTINSEDRDTAFATLTQFRDSISSMARKASLNPMNYVDKVVVEYKNPANTLIHPYATSQYSGMIVDYGL